MNAFVYVHKNPVTLQVFYVGIGVDSQRPHSKKNRNIYWRRYVNKYGWPIIEVIYKELTWALACDIEKSMISAFGKVQDGGVLVNMTNGGDGAVGVKYTGVSLQNKIAAANRPEVKAKLRAHTLRQWATDEFREAVRKSSSKRLLENNPNNAPGAKEKQSKHARENNSFSKPEVKEKLKKSWIDRKKDPVFMAKFEVSRLKGVESMSKKIHAIDGAGHVFDFSSIRKAAKFMGVNKSAISLRLNNPKKQLNGYFFKYA